VLVPAASSACALTKFLDLSYVPHGYDPSFF
jgi:hypothetical protein